MDSLPDAEEVGFRVSAVAPEEEESISLDGKDFPRDIPEPVFLQDTPVYKSIYAPEYDDFKQLFRCHATKSDYYIVYPSAARIERAPVIPQGVVTPQSSVNAFSSGYKEEVVHFISKLSSLLASSGQKSVSSGVLKRDLFTLKDAVSQCTENPTLFNVNHLRALHAELLQKYERDLSL
ncbi:hypothetical protein WA556_001877 [Blastocystis sp. ATCC 50177/Nand II]